MIRRHHCPFNAPDAHLQVLWHTAAAFSKKLVQSAQLPAERLSEQIIELAADRHRRQQHAIPAPSQSEPDAGAETFHATCTLPLAWSSCLALLATFLGK